jgi:hypothetical protein
MKVPIGRVSLMLGRYSALIDAQPSNVNLGAKLSWADFMVGHICRRSPFERFSLPALAVYLRIIE